MNLKKLSLFGSLFLIPEILWSTLLNFYYSFLKPTIGGSSQVLRDNFLLRSDNIDIYLLILVIQTIGLVGCIIVLCRAKINNTKKIVYLLPLIVFFCLEIFALYVVVSMINGIGF
jgi:hypothetical protein